MGVGEQGRSVWLCPYWLLEAGSGLCVGLFLYYVWNIKIFFLIRILQAARQADKYTNGPYLPIQPITSTPLETSQFRLCYDQVGYLKDAAPEVKWAALSECFRNLGVNMEAMCVVGRPN